MALFALRFVFFLTIVRSWGMKKNCKGKTKMTSVFMLCGKRTYIMKIYHIDSSKGLLRAWPSGKISRNEEKDKKRPRDERKGISNWSMNIDKLFEERESSENR